MPSVIIEGNAVIGQALDPVALGIVRSYDPEPGISEGILDGFVHKRSDGAITQILLVPDGTDAFVLGSDVLANALHREIQLMDIDFLLE